MQEGRNMTMMMAPSKAVLAGRIDVGETPNGEVREGAHMGDVASAAIDSPSAPPPLADAEMEAPADEQEAAAVLAEAPPEDGASSSADTAVS